MKTRLLPLALLLAALAQPAIAAPWRTTTLEQSGLNLHYAFQSDETGKFTFLVSCTAGRGGYTIAVITPRPWDHTASYAPDVLTTMTFDGVAFPDNLMFGFLDAGGFESVAYRNQGSQDELGRLLVELKKAGRFELSFFDTTLAFSGQGSSAAMKGIAAACGL